MLCAEIENIREACKQINKPGQTGTFPEGALVMAGLQWTVCVGGKLRNVMNKVVKIKADYWGTPMPDTYVVPERVYMDPSTPEHAVWQELMTRIANKDTTSPVTSHNVDGPLMTTVKPAEGDLVLVAGNGAHVPGHYFCVVADGNIVYCNGAVMNTPYTHRRFYVVPKSVYTDPTTPEYTIHHGVAPVATATAAQMKADGKERISTGMASTIIRDERALAALSLMTDNVKRVKVRANVWLKPDGTRTAKLFLHVYPKTGACSQFGDITRRFTPKDVNSGVGFTKSMIKHTKADDTTVEPVLTMLAPMVDLDAIGTQLLADAWAIAENN